MELIHYYEDLNTLHVGTEKPRCYYLPKKTDGTDSYRLLSGNDWRFFYYPNPQSVDEKFVLKDYENPEYVMMEVPSCWQSRAMTISIIRVVHLSYHMIRRMCRMRIHVVLIIRILIYLMRN